MKRRDMLARLALGTTPFVLGESFAGVAQHFVSGKPESRFGDGRDWFFEKRFGMFVHWGLYAIPAWHEQYQWRASVPRAQYAKLINEFNPQKFSPDRWLDLLQEAGMEYLTFTTKHHDGFCMWDTAQTTFNVMRSPYRQDILGKLADACHKRKIPLCLYYSIVDWHHRNYPNQGRHHELLKPEQGDEPDWNKYMQFLKAQVKELCSNYGEIHGFWWDMNVPKYKDPSVNDMIRKMQPNAVINNRGFDDGDFGTPERDYADHDAKKNVADRPTEACQSVGSLSWGYKKDEEYYSDRYLISSIDRYLAGGANYLLNIGPDAEGIMPDRPAAILKRIGKWYPAVKESFARVSPVPSLVQTNQVALTKRDLTVYVHFNKELPTDAVSLKPVDCLPGSAVLLNNGSPVSCVIANTPMDYPDKKAYLRLQHLPASEFPDTVLVVKLDFDKPLPGSA